MKLESVSGKSSDLSFARVLIFILSAVNGLVDVVLHAQQHLVAGQLVCSILLSRNITQLQT